MSTAAEQEMAIKTLIQNGQMREAAEACDRLNLEFPEYEHGWYAASHLAMLLREPLLAVRAIDRALQLSPGNPEWLFQRVECLRALGEIDAARETAKLMSGHVFDSAQTCEAVGYTLAQLGLLVDARLHYLHATELEPANAPLHYGLATVEQFLGNIEAARKAVSQCLELKPDDERAHNFRARLNTQSPLHNNIASLEAAYERSEDDPVRRSKLCYALSKELEDVGNFESSFKFLSEGASIRRGRMQYQPQDDLDAMQRVREIHTSELFDGHVDGYINAEPIFVIGMPRTGSGLLQRILSAHSVVYSAGELNTFSVQLSKHCQVVAGKEVTRGVDLVPYSASVDFMALGEDYIAGTRPATGKTAHFVDSLPLNFLYAGLIHLALPKARIVLLERDPMDTCYALYKHLFDGVCAYSYDLEELANYLLAYQKLIDHWKSVIPNVMHIVRYEELVSDPKPVVQNLLSYCGLSWEDECLSYYENTYASTANDEAKVRGQVFQASVGKWTNFAEQLKPALDILGGSNN